MFFQFILNAHWPWENPQEEHIKGALSNMAQIACRQHNLYPTVYNEVHPKNPTTS